MGSHDGYVTSPNDLYYMGENPAGFKGGSYVTFQSNQIVLGMDITSNTTRLTSTKTYNFTGYNAINCQFLASGGNKNYSGPYRIGIELDGFSSRTDYEDLTEGKLLTASFSLSVAKLTSTVRLQAGNSKDLWAPCNFIIRRIWLS